MANKEVKEIEVLEGTVTSAFPPTRMEDGNYRPANILITTDGDESEQVRISQFPNSNFDTKVFYEPIQMPTWYEALPENIRDLVDSRVQVIASPKGEWNGVRQFNYVQSFKVLKLAHEPQPRTAQPRTAQAAATPAWGSIDERIAWNSAINNAVHALSGNDPLLPEYIGKVDTLASLLYELIRRGPDSPVDAPEAEADEQAYDKQIMEDLFGRADGGVLPVE